MDVGRVKLYLLDTNIEDNADPEYRDITDQLYGGDSDTRIRQEIVLGHRRPARAEGAGARRRRCST